MKSVSLAWVLNQLAGLKFPEQGSAWDFIKRSADNAECQTSTLECLQTTYDFLKKEPSCREVSLAITKLEEARHWLKARDERVAREQAEIPEALRFSKNGD